MWLYFLPLRSLLIAAVFFVCGRSGFANWSIFWHNSADLRVIAVRAETGAL
jgi:hypothetical protein